MPWARNFCPFRAYGDGLGGDLHFMNLATLGGMVGERDNKKRCLQKSASIALYCFWGMFDITY